MWAPTQKLGEVELEHHQTLKQKVVWFLTNSEDSKEMFLRKIAFCAQPFDFNDESVKISEKNERLKFLSELSDTLGNQLAVINLVIPNLDSVVDMIQKNIFRPLPVVRKGPVPGEMGMEEEEIPVDPSWPHL